MMYSQNDHPHDCSRRCNKLNKLSDKVGLEIEIKKLERLRVKKLTMVIEKYMLTIGVRSVGGRPDITFENIYF